MKRLFIKSRFRNSNGKSERWLNSFNLLFKRQVQEPAQNPHWVETRKIRTAHKRQPPTEPNFIQIFFSIFILIFIYLFFISSFILFCLDAVDYYWIYSFLQRFVMQPLERRLAAGESLKDPEEKICPALMALMCVLRRLRILRESSGQSQMSARLRRMSDWLMPRWFLENPVRISFMSLDCLSVIQIL